MIFPYPRDFPADAIESRVPDPGSARALVRERRPELLALLQRRRERLAQLFGPKPSDLVERAENTVLMAFCRLAFRHGTWGEDFHAYHNENHALEILGPRIERLLDTVGLPALSLRDWFLLMLFGAAHDLRQRETPQFSAGIGSNERASVEETFRILIACGFTPEANLDIFLAIELMIAGSTFDARPSSMREYNSAELVVQSGGALAQKLDQKLDKHAPGWRADADMAHALQLALIAADLDTANVAEPFPLFMASTERLCLEREMRNHRDPAEAEAALPILNFLSEGSKRYFFELHRFSSDYGRETFAAAKNANAGKLHLLTEDLVARCLQHGQPRNGSAVLETFRQIVNAIG